MEKQGGYRPVRLPARLCQMSRWFCISRASVLSTLAAHSSPPTPHPSPYLPQPFSPPTPLNPVTGAGACKPNQQRKRSQTDREGVRNVCGLDDPCRRVVSWSTARDPMHAMQLMPSEVSLDAAARSGHRNRKHPSLAMHATSGSFPAMMLALMPRIVPRMDA